MDMITEKALDLKQEIIDGLQACYTQKTGYTEVRVIRTALPKNEIFGMFFNLADDPNCFEKMADFALSYSDDDSIQGVYHTVNPSGTKRQCGRILKQLTNDTDIIQCYRLLIDLDPIRKDANGNKINGKMNCTETEKQQAINKAEQIKDWINVACGEQLQPVEIDSGNGVYLHYKFLPPAGILRDTIKETIRDFLHYLTKRFSDDSVHIDTSVYNPSRIQRVPGTWNRKGDGGFADRPKKALVRLLKVQTTDETLVWDCLSRIMQQAKEPQINYVTTPAPSMVNPGMAVQKTELSRDEALKQAIKRTTRLRESIAGQNGHNTAISAVCFIHQRYPILSKEEVKFVLSDWNNRCQPPWSDAEIDHKINDAWKKETRYEPAYKGLNNNNREEQDSEEEQAWIKFWENEHYKEEEKAQTEYYQQQNKQSGNSDVYTNDAEVILHTGKLESIRTETISKLNSRMKKVNSIVLLDHKGVCSDVFVHQEKITKGCFTQPAGTAVIRKTSDSLIRLTLSKHLDFIVNRLDRYGEPIRRSVDAPLALVKAISDEPGGLVQLHFLAHGPYINFQNKKLVNKTGIDTQTCRYLVQEVEGLENLIPEEPTHIDAKNALNTLWNAVREFPWLYNHKEKCQIEDNMLNHDGNRQDQIINQSFIKWLTLLIAQACRLELDTVPIGLITGNCAGLGKSYLANAISMILFGKTANVTVLPEGSNMQAREEETRKRIISMIDGGATLALFDNVSRSAGAEFSSAVLEALITSSYFSDRKLGTNSMTGGLHRLQVIVTGNGTNPSEDMAQRTIFVKLESNEPNRRHNFKPQDGDFLEYCQKNRKSLLAATLCIIKAWLHAGSPKPESAHGIGSFPDFNRIAVACAHWVSGIDPLEGRETDIQQGDTKSQALAALIGVWNKLLGNEFLTCGQILETIKTPSLGKIGSEENTAFREALMEVVPGVFRSDDLPSAKQLGRALKALVNTPTFLVDDNGVPIASGKIIHKQNALNSSVYSVYIQKINKNKIHNRG